MLVRQRVKNRARKLEQSEKRKRKRARTEEQDEKERDLFKSSLTGLETQRKDMNAFIESFTKVQEQQVNTMNAVVGALTNFLQNSNKKIKLTIYSSNCGLHNVYRRAT